jgi:hypothetical protein
MFPAKLPTKPSAVRLPIYGRGFDWHRDVRRNGWVCTGFHRYFILPVLTVVIILQGRLMKCHAEDDRSLTHENQSIGKKPPSITLRFHAAFDRF